MKNSNLHLYTVINAAWLLTAFSFVVFLGPGFPGVNGILVFATVPYWLAGGGMLIVLTGIAAVQSGWSRRTVTFTALGPLLAVACLVGAPWIHDVQRQIYFRSHGAAYERVVADVEAGRVPLVLPWQEAHGVAFVVDSGPPLRVAFPWPGGLMDNWIGVVYDPTGVVLESQQFQPDWSNWYDPELASVKALFGGDMFYCRPLSPVWYLCSFT